MIVFLASPVLNVLSAVGLATVLAALLGFIITVVFRFFAVESNEKEEAILELLPGVNCGGCGYSGCQGYAAALADGSDTNLGKCTAGGKDTMDSLSEYFGQVPATFIPKLAVVRCQGSNEQVRVRYQYEGSVNCHTANGLFGGPGTCSHGCLGFGDCVRACEYDAIEVKNGVAVVNPDKCIACGACVEACPRALISIEPKFQDLTIVRCMNPDAGKDVRKVCDIGCIGCTLCVKKCPEQCISMVDKRAVIDQERCTQCGTCAGVCPTHAITQGLKQVKASAAVAKA